MPEREKYRRRSLSRRLPRPTPSAPRAAADALRLNGEARATNIKLTGEPAAAIEARAKAPA
jgi:hypothetical protein